MSGCHPSVKSELHCEHGISHYSEKACDICRPAIINWTICGFCNERVKVDQLHGCEMVKSIKEKFDSALRAIQHDYEIQIKHQAGRIDSLKQSLDHVIANVKGIDYLIKQMGLCVDTWKS